jgi:RNA polymerase sigma-70 factor, ECF subfamily
VGRCAAGGRGLVSAAMPGTHVRRPDRSEQELLAAAQRGDEGAVRHLLESHRADLHTHCYRMLGSPHDADDAMQDALLRAWRGLPRFQGRSAFRTWLRRIATNVCLDVIRRSPKRVLPIDHDWSADEVAAGEPLRGSGRVEDYPAGATGFEPGRASPEASYERREAVELALIAALRHLPPRQRAALILRDVFGFSAKETARALGTTLASVNSALQRARQALHGGLIQQSELASLRSFGDDGTRALVERYMAALEGTDVDGLLSLLTEDITLRYRLRRRHSTLGHTRLEPPGAPIDKGQANEPSRRHQQHHPRRRHAQPKSV